jgi:uncharacterized phage-associated protein
MKVAPVANYILSLSEPEAGDEISNLKLQKLLYYVQGFSLVLLKKPMFEESIQHWEHGPVVPEAYHAFKNYGSSGIPVPGDFDPDCLSQDCRKLINDVYSAYGQFSAWKLRQMTHEESPWLRTESGEVISHALLREYFETQVSE